MVMQAMIGVAPASEQAAPRFGLARDFDVDAGDEHVGRGAVRGEGVEERVCHALGLRQLAPASEGEVVERDGDRTLRPRRRREEGERGQREQEETNHSVRRYNRY